MGWSTGGVILDEIIESLKKNVDDDDSRKAVYRDVIPLFEQYDCDTMYESVGIDDAFDEILKEHDPDYFEEEEEE